MKGDLFLKNHLIARVLETFNGDLYFIKDVQGDEIYCYARLYCMPDCAEWGFNSLKSLKESYGANGIWDVPRKDWPSLLTYNIDGLVIL